jgi:hypothetical protein
MHDATHIANGGKKSSQPRMHCWYVFDSNYCGHAVADHPALQAVQ